MSIGDGEVSGAQKRVKRYPKVPQYITSMELLLKLCPPTLCQTNTVGLVFNIQYSTGSSFAVSVLGYSTVQRTSVQDGSFSDLDYLDPCCSSKEHTTVEGGRGT